MEILAHRGDWTSDIEKNQMKALSLALQKGYGVETDIRDYNGELVISHDIATFRSILLKEFFQIYNNCNSSLPLALNVKADGIQDKLKLLLSQFSITNYFLFDMSIPEMVINKQKNLNFYTRHSDIETECVFYEYAQGVWLDSFYNMHWLSRDIINEHLYNHKKMGIISPEIHGYDNCYLWEMLKKYGFHKDKNVMLCTDKPHEAKEYFEL